VSEDHVRSALRQVPLPDEAGAAQRAWRTVDAAFESRERIPWTRKRRGPLVALVATGAILVAALTPPGMAVVDRFRDAVGREPSQPALVKLPAPGRLLVLSPEGPWVVQEDGSKRLLGDYENDDFESGRGLRVRENAVAALATLSAILGIDAHTIRLHREDPLTTHACPGKHVRKLEIIQEVQDLLIARHAGEHPIKPAP